MRPRSMLTEGRLTRRSQSAAETASRSRAPSTGRRCSVMVANDRIPEGTDEEVETLDQGRDLGVAGIPATILREVADCTPGRRRHECPGSPTWATSGAVNGSER